MTRNTVAEIDLQAIRDNLGIVRQLAPASAVACVVKADAYGHGLRRVVPVLESSDILAVATLGEASLSRQAGWKGRLVLLEGPSSLDECRAAASLNAELVIHHASQLAHLKKADGAGRKRLWLKIDSGMHRLGFPAGEARAAFDRLGSFAGLERIVLMSHFAIADVADNDMTLEQIAKFEAAIEGLDGPVSLANSAAILNFPQSHRDIVRPGIMLYGVSPCADKTAADIGLRPAMTLRCDIIAVNRCKKGDPVGYGAVHRCPEDMNVAVAAIGYGDGYPRGVRPATPVLLHGRKAPLIGPVSMDMISIDLRSHPEARVGDSVTLWGKGLPVEEIARCARAIPYELICGVTARVKYRYTGR